MLVKPDFSLFNSNSIGVAFLDFWVDTRDSYGNNSDISMSNNLPQNSLFSLSERSLLSIYFISSDNFSSPTSGVL
ncbi:MULTISPECIES: hypothetical protein [unclassified Okeania]|uniref:hypothetical protein n=1 Tax=unclassified Okeania TaxID=2634635 RepID=UPI0013BA0B6E|nr:MULTISPECIES: hypothetical protein [unclassified Okeania]NEP07566.1 hypothetical protein [Okeania sp. SIO4D6]NET15195.1 hypothetical protein [Okeania sp. SIO1H6]NEP75368.1 hypothetical protein [Okeania sp. SIO2G5]NEP96448.1 hypothetical protein [Okeania sp. SIO2F5]NEQ94201.1 hypothetical protein [Okeania sp. SIO2G4]